MADEVKQPVLSKQKQNQLLQKQKQKQKEQQQQKKMVEKISLEGKLKPTSGSCENDGIKQNIGVGTERKFVVNDSKSSIKDKISANSSASAGASKDNKNQQSHIKASTQITASDKKKRHLAMFDHLLKKFPGSTCHTDDPIEGDLSIHPATIKLGSLYRLGYIRDDDDRVAALLSTFSFIIKGYSAPPNKSFRYDLDKYIRTQVQHLVDCRQHSMGMGNVIKFIRYAISQVSPEVNEAEAKSTLLNQISLFCEERILFARESIIKHSQSAIRDGDVILTFGSSTIVTQILLTAAAACSFRVVVVDARPLCDGQRTLRALSPALACVYTPVSGAAAVMKDVTRVFLGASALLANGAVVAPAGTALVAALAKDRQIPVIVVAESYKFCDKVQLDSIVFNELGAAAELITACALTEEEAEREKTLAMAAGRLLEKDPIKCVPEVGMVFKGALERPFDEAGEGLSVPFQVINLRYDLTPISNVSVVATEGGFIPPTSVPVLISELRVDESS